MAIPVTAKYVAPVVKPAVTAAKAVITNTPKATTTVSNQAAINAEIARKAAAGIPLAGDKNGNITSANQATYDAAIAKKLSTPSVATNPTPAPTPAFTMDDINGSINNAIGGLNIQGLFGGMQSQYDEKFAALQRMLTDQQAASQKQYDELMNKFKYTTSQPLPASTNSNALDATQVDTPTVNNGSAQIGIAQPNDANSALYRYLNNMWGGGF